jgi:signal transduction histidine kinase
MGIGLSLVKMIIDGFDGKIWIQDRVKGDYSKGSNFCLLLKKADE